MVADCCIGNRQFNLDDYALDTAPRSAATLTIDLHIQSYEVKLEYDRWEISLAGVYNPAKENNMRDTPHRTITELEDRLQRANEILAEPARQIQQLEHSLATGFIKLQKERNPAQRQAQWVELQRLAGEIERLGE